MPQQLSEIIKELNDKELIDFLNSEVAFTEVKANERKITAKTPVAITSWFLRGISDKTGRFFTLKYIDGGIAIHFRRKIEPIN